MMPTHEEVGTALAAASQKAQQPYGSVYVSPSVREGSTFNHALSEFLSEGHKRLLQDGERMGGSSIPALGTWADGAEEIALLDTPPELTRRIGAVLGMKYKQKVIAMFHPDEQGTGEQHILEFHKPIPLENLYKKLLHLGIEYSTFLPDAQDPLKIEGLHVLSDEGDGVGDKLRKQFSYFARHVVNKGKVEIPAAPTREEAARMFKGMLSTDH